jgi:hypothetical protein
MKDNIIAYKYLQSRGVTRLCHFTKVKSLVHILTSEDGILATDYINQDVKQQNDMERYDNATDCVCCSLQYPNGWYWDQAKKRDSDQIFKEWCVLTINLDILKNARFRFCPCNSAYKSGSLIRNDVENISAIFDDPNIRMRYRPTTMLDCCPTDDQAEILVYKNIPLQFVNGIIIGNSETADNIGAILKTIGKDLPIFISPDVCNTNWSKQIRSGCIPQEEEYNYRGE